VHILSTAKEQVDPTVAVLATILLAAVVVIATVPLAISCVRRTASAGADGE
jgi:ABC-type spermidine/putrescine transport system permease subunit II